MASFAVLVDRVSAALWNLHPHRAVGAGKHEYDGQVPDLSPGSVAAGLDRLGRLRAQVAGLEGLTAAEEPDRTALLAAADRELFDGEVARRWGRDPCRYLEALDVAPYLELDYAPAGLRLERAAAVLTGAGGLLAAARAGLEEALPRVWGEQGIASAREQATTVASLAGGVEAAGSDPATRRMFAAAAASAAAELEGFASWLEAERLPAVEEGCALGGEALEALVRAGERLSLTAGDLSDVGAELLAQDEGALAAAAAEAAPGLQTAEACRQAAASGATLDPRAAEAAVEEAQRFVEAHGLTSVPAGAGLRVAAGRRPAPGEAGWLRAPGPYDDPSAPAILFVAAAGPGPAALADLAASAAYPGRLLQALHAARAPGEARRRFPSEGFGEGWALYAGDLMAAAGFGAGSPGWRLLGLRRVVRADCRLVCAVGWHAGGMTLEEAEAVFARHAHLDAAEARAEALRSAADPGCLAGALGRWELLRLRRRWEAARPGGSLRGFHDALLGAGALPLGLMEQVVPW